MRSQALLAGKALDGMGSPMAPMVLGPKSSKNVQRCPIVWSSSTPTGHACCGHIAHCGKLNELAVGTNKRVQQQCSKGRLVVSLERGQRQVSHAGQVYTVMADSTMQSNPARTRSRG